MSRRIVLVGKQGPAFGPHPSFTVVKSGLTTASTGMYPRSERGVSLMAAASKVAAAEKSWTADGREG